MATYTLEWLENAVTALNPARGNFVEPGPFEVETFVTRIREETMRQKVVIKNQAFQLFEKKKRRVLIKGYHLCFVVLMDKAYENMATGAALSKPFHDACQALISAIAELLEFLDEHFGDLIGCDRRVPATYLENVKIELHASIAAFEKKLYEKTRSKELTGILLHSLYGFTSRPQARKVSFREVFYKKELVKQIEDILASKGKVNFRESLMQRLVYLNYNSRAFIDYYTGWVAGEANAIQDGPGRLDYLLLSFKQFSQMHHKPGLRLNPDYQDLQTKIGKWFAAEIAYLRGRTAPGEATADWRGVQGKGPKARVGLTVDQVAVAVRAMVDIKILEVGSVSQAFRLLVPFLSSQHQQNISWDSMRRKAYQVEDRDKQVVVDVLEKTIKVIREY